MNALLTPAPTLLGRPLTSFAVMYLYLGKQKQVGSRFFPEYRYYVFDKQADARSTAFLVDGYDTFELAHGAVLVAIGAAECDWCGERGCIRTPKKCNCGHEQLACSADAAPDLCRECDAFNPNAEAERIEADRERDAYLRSDR